MSTNTSPKPTVAQTALPAEIEAEIEQALAGGLAEMSLRELLSLLLSSAALAERNAYLRHTPGDKGNGSYARALDVGSLDLHLDVPRTRSGQFRPTLLPALYRRGYSEESQHLLLALLSSSRSINAAKTALKKLGIACSEDELDTVAKEFLEDFELRNSRPLAPDLIALFVDGKYVEFKDGERIRPATIYVAVGIDREGKKRVLACVTRPGRETLEEWKKLLRTLLERGLRRVLIVVHDDFSGLLPVTQSLFPQADVQLCIVHMQRNAKTHLGKTEASEFTQRMRAIKACYSPERAALEFDELCQRFETSSPTFIAELRKKREHYLGFLHYPEPLQPTLSTTNVVEAVNGQLERLRRNNGGYFQSEENLKLKLGIAMRSLEDGKWVRPCADARYCIDQLNALFERRFETAS
jgi:transposase-like protein